MNWQASSPYRTRASRPRNSPLPERSIRLQRMRLISQTIAGCRRIATARMNLRINLAPSTRLESACGAPRANFLPDVRRFSRQAAEDGKIRKNRTRLTWRYGEAPGRARAMVGQAAAKPAHSHRAKSFGEAGEGLRRGPFTRRESEDVSDDAATAAASVPVAGTRTLAQLPPPGAPLEPPQLALRRRALLLEKRGAVDKNRRFVSPRARKRPPAHASADVCPGRIFQE